MGVPEEDALEENASFSEDQVDGSMLDDSLHKEPFASMINLS